MAYVALDKVPTLFSYSGNKGTAEWKAGSRDLGRTLGGRTVHLVNGDTITDVDHIIFGTGYTWTYIVWRHDPTLLVGTGLTFKIFEWQAVYAARLLAGGGTLPSVEEMQKWNEDRIKERGDGPGFALVFPDFEEYFETVRELAGEPENGTGRKLPKFEQEWLQTFEDGHELRKKMW